MHVPYTPFSREVRSNPYPIYDDLRARAPVSLVGDVGAWAVARYEDVHSVLSHPELFSSDAMRTMFMSQKPTADPSQDAEAAERMLAIASALPFTVEEMVRARNLISTDPPEHEVMRRIVSRGFTPRRIAAYERRVHEVVRRCLDAVRDGAEFDLVRDLAVPVPTVIIAEMLGVEPERYGDFRRWSDMVISQSTGSRRGQSFSETGYVEMIRELSLYLLSIMERRRHVPADDLVTTLIAAQEGDGTLTPMEVVTFTILLLVAGNETTTNLIGNVVNALLDHPDQLARLGTNPELVPAAIEETLRWDGPIQFFFRRARRDVTVAGVPLPENAIVMPLLGSANRDERQFRRAEVFDVTRDAGGHLAFGVGIHYCLGAALARLEARIAVEALLDELPHLRRTDPRVEHIDSFLIRGPQRLMLARAA